MFKIDKWVILLLIAFLLLIVIPSGFAHEIDNNLTVDDESNIPIESVEETDTLQESSNDYYFNASALDDNGDGSKERPYKYLTAYRIKANANIHLADGEYRLDNTKDIQQVTFIGCDANRTVITYEGIAFKVWNTLTLNNLTIKNATIWNYKNLNATNTIFANALGRNPDSYGNNFGGAINCPYYSQSYTPTVNIRNCAFLENYAEYGGAIYMDGGSLDITDSMFINNFAYNFGGAIAGESGTKIKISGTKFYNSSSVADAGGAIYLRSSSLDLSNVDIYNSSATFGGAITTLNTDVKLNHLNVYNSSAKWDGGAIYHMYGNFTSLYGVFSNNSARNGGALFIDNSTNLGMIQNRFEYNRASFCAGAVYSLCNIIKGQPIQRSRFVDNTALINNNEYISSSINLTIGNGNYTMYKNVPSEIDILPSYYCLREHNLLTIPKDQQASGNCWAFTAIAVLESAILKASGDYLDLSEENMKNVIAQFSDYGWDIETNEGGYDNMPIGYLAGWLGPVFEINDTFDDHSTLSPVLNSVMHVQNVLFLKRDNYTDNDAIKKAIMKYGAVGTSMYYDDYYFRGNGGYYCWSYPSSNHAVTIVGWDDNYSSSHFYGSPEGDGAWIVRNSWGSEWKDNGYFYVSYYDRKLAQPGVDNIAYTIILNDTIKYDKNYQYDIAGQTDFYYTDSDQIWYKNKFTAENDEYLAGVSTYFEKIANWTASVYVNGDLKVVRNGLSNPGYFTFDLGKLIHLTAGDIFEVAFNVSGFNPVSMPISEYYSLNKEIYKPEISYYSFDGENWMDLYNQTGTYATHTYYSQVACIKAFTIFNEINTFLDLAIDSNELGFINITATVIDEYGNLVNSGNVTFILNGMEQVVNVTHGIATLTHSFGNNPYSVYATFNGTGYNSSTASHNIINETIDLNLEIIKYQNNVNITVSTLNTINGEVTLIINNKPYKANLTNGQYTFNFTLENGDYGVEVFLMDFDYQGYNSSNFAMDVKGTIIEANDLNVDEGKIIYSVNLTDESGNPLSSRVVNFTINNNEYYNITDDDGKACISIDLPMGLYEVSSDFYGDSEYLSSTSLNTINVRSVIEIGVDYEIKRNNIIIEALFTKPVNENVSFIINGRPYYNMSSEGRAILILNNLENNEYELKVALVNTTNYSFEPKEDNFIIAFYSYVKVDPVEQHFVGDSFDIIIYNDTQVNVTVNDVPYNISNGKIDIDTAKLAFGEYTVVASIMDGDYLVNSSSITFNIVKKASKINNLTFSSREVVVGQNASISVLMSDDEDGNVSITINNATFTETIRNGVAQFNATLPIGNYRVTATYLGSDRYNASDSVVGEFDVVDKLTPAINISAPDTAKVGEEIIISANAEYGVEVTLTINGNPLNDDGKYTIDAAGAYVIVARTAESELYHAAFSSTTVYAIKNDATLIINPITNAEVGKEVNINVENVSGPITIKVNGEVIDDVFIPNNEGTYVVTVESIETEAYYRGFNSTTFEVSRQMTDIGLSVGEVVDNEVTVSVKLPSDATGTILLNINGTKVAIDTQDYNPRIVLASGFNDNLRDVKTADYTLNIVLNAPGMYAVNATYLGDRKYQKAISNTVIIEIPEKPEAIPTNITMNIANDVISLDWPENASGNVVIKIDGREVYNGDANETPAIDLTGYLPGNHIVEIDYSGDENYAGEIKTQIFSVPKAETTITAKPIAFEEGNSSAIEVDIPGIDSGFVLVDVDNKKFYGDINAGKASISIHGLAAGNYTAKISFAGDEKFNATTYSVDVVVSAKEEPENNVTVIVDGVEYPAVVVNGTVIVDINKTEPDNNVTVIVDGVEYPVEVINGTVTIDTNKAEPEFPSTVVVDGKEYPVVYVDGTAVVDTNTTVPELPSSVVVDGKEYPVVYVDGAAVVDTNTTVPELPSSVVVDGKEYPAEVVDGKVTVKTNASEPAVKERLGTIITAEDFTQWSCDYTVGERGGYFVGLLTDSNGKPLVNKTVQIGYNGINFNRTTNGTGHFAVQIGLQNAGLYTFGMAYLDDNDYNASFLVRGITIVKKPTSIVAKNSAFKAKKKTKKVTVKLETIVGSAIDGKVYLKAGKKLTLTVNGVTYKAKTDANGKATFKITKLNKKGKYKAKIKFAGDTFVYKKSSAKIKITVI
ncbi:Ig-like domain repeat protein [Methanobrevibacter sp.]|uniref:Ig-like domain repeat protein n=1 Tax=Methanobrevibacter sp. TaxID=66852 RepID=UPI00388DFA94